MFWVSRSWTWLTWVGRVALGVDGDDLDALLLGVGLDRLLDLVEEVRLQIGDGQADLLDFRGLRRSPSDSAMSAAAEAERAFC